MEGDAFVGDKETAPITVKENSEENVETRKGDEEL